MVDNEGTTPSKAFGAMIAFYRLRAGLTPEQLGPKVFLSGSMIRKVEAGTRIATEDLVKALEAIPELETNGALLALYDKLGDQIRNGLAYPGWFAPWPDKESHAVRLRSFELVVIPGLLQTAEYARALLSTTVGLTADELEKRVDGRIVRQKILTRDNPVELWSVLDEAALLRSAGSAQVMAGQLKHVAEMARLPHIVVQVIPLEAGEHKGQNGGAFVVAEFTGAPLAAYQDTALEGQIIEDEEKAAELAKTWDTLRMEALPVKASIARIEEWADKWSSRLGAGKPSRRKAGASPLSALATAATA